MFESGTETEVQELMSKTLETVRETDCVRDALQRMTAGRISALPVLDGEARCVGILSIVDLLRVLMVTEEMLESDYPGSDEGGWAIDLIRERLGTDAVNGTMSAVLTTVSPDTTMHDAACIMLNHRVHHLPVVHSSGRLVGMLSSSDFVKLAAGSERR